MVPSIYHSEDTFILYLEGFIRRPHTSPGQRAFLLCFFFSLSPLCAGVVFSLHSQPQDGCSSLGVRSSYNISEKERPPLLGDLLNSTQNGWRFSLLCMAVSTAPTAPEGTWYSSPAHTQHSQDLGWLGAQRVKTAKGQKLVHLERRKGQ